MSRFVGYLNQFVIGDKGKRAKIKNLWDLLMIFVIIYVSAIVSYRIAFAVDQS